MEGARLGQEHATSRGRDDLARFFDHRLGHESTINALRSNLSFVSG